MIFKTDCKTLSYFELKELLKSPDIIAFAQIRNEYRTFLFGESKGGSVGVEPTEEAVQCVIWNEVPNFYRYHLTIVTYPLQNPIKNIIKSPT